MSIFKKFYNKLSEISYEYSLNDVVFDFFQENDKTSFILESDYQDIDIYLDLICKKYGTSAITLFIAHVRQSSPKWSGLPLGYAKNLNAIKKILSDVIIEMHSVDLNALNIGSRNLMFVMPTLPGNKNNNISNFILSYIAEFQKIGVPVKLLLTGELNVKDSKFDSTWGTNTISMHRKIIEGYGGDSKDIIYLEHDEYLPKSLIEQVNLFSPNLVVVPNFELICSYAPLLRRVCKVAFMQTNINNTPSYIYDYFLSCGTVDLITDNMSKEAIVYRHKFGYPKFSFSSVETTSKESNTMKLVFASNRVERELDDDYLSKLANLLINYERVEFHILGVRDQASLLEKLERFFPKEIIANRIFLNGYLENMGDYLEKCHVYLNTMRLGGGVSMALSLYAQTPVLVVGKSDAINFLDGVGCFDSYDQQFKYLQLLIEDPLELKKIQSSQVVNFEKNYTSNAAVVALTELFFERLVI